MKISFTINGNPVSLDTDPARRLLDLLREEMQLFAAKEGCGEGECGACTVLLDGRAVNSCLLPAGLLDGHSVWTLEGLLASGQIEYLTGAFTEKDAIQCGFCTPGFLLAAHDYLSRGGDDDPGRIRLALDGNICRCTGYSQIVEAIVRAARHPDRPRPAS